MANNKPAFESIDPEKLYALYYGFNEEAVFRGQTITADSYKSAKLIELVNEDEKFVIVEDIDDHLLIGIMTSSFYEECKASNYFTHPCYDYTYFDDFDEAEAYFEKRHEELISKREEV